MQVLNTRIKKIIPMYIIVTWIEYVKVLEASKKKIAYHEKRHSLRVSFNGLVAQEIILDLSFGFQ